MVYTVQLLTASFGAGIVTMGAIWIIVGHSRKRAGIRAQRERLDAVTELGKLLAEAETLITSHNLGDIQDSVYRKRLVSVLDVLNRKLKSTMPVMDGIHVKFFDQELQRLWQSVYTSAQETRMPPGQPSTPTASPSDHSETLGAPVPGVTPRSSPGNITIPPQSQSRSVQRQDRLSESLATQETMRIDLNEIRSQLTNKVSLQAETIDDVTNDCSLTPSNDATIQPIVPRERDYAESETGAFHPPTIRFMEGTPEPVPVLYASNTAGMPHEDPASRHESTEAKPAIVSGDDVAQKLDSLFGFAA